MLLDLLLWHFVWLPLFVAVGYILAIQYERPQWYFKLLTPFTALVALADAYLNYTTAQVVFWEWARKDEVTLSQRCKRLVNDAGWRGVLARVIAHYTNYFDPTPPHIPLP